MTNAPADLASHRSFTGSWSAASATDDLQRWSEFLAQHGLTWSPDAQVRDFVDQMIRSSPARAGEMIELRLEKLANDALKEKGDARRVSKQRSSEPASRLYVLSPEQRSALEKSGVRFETGMSRPLSNLATIPITLGVYFAAKYACDAAGLSANVAWVIALVAYVLTVRVVRGRWPLTPAR
jgi:hypothetical protein